MRTYDLLMLAPMFVLLVGASVHDLRARRIPNLLNLILVLSGLALSFTPMGRVSPGYALAGLLVGFGLTFVMFAIGALGGGDVKLLAGVGAWLGPADVLYVFLAAAVIGMVIVLAQSAYQGRLRTLFRNSTVLAMGLAHAGETGIGHFVEAGQSTPRSVDKPLPYAVPVLIATACVVLG